MLPDGRRGIERERGRVDEDEGVVERGAKTSLGLEASLDIFAWWNTAIGMQGQSVQVAE